uniref:ATP synthase subunit b n=1 Tax=Heliothis virescens TaxID=7102 RepID=A0A2A4JM46_HELVI
MLAHKVVSFLIPQHKILIPIALDHTKAHTETCPARARKVCPGSIGAKKKAGAAPVKKTKCTPRARISPQGKGSGDGPSGGTGLKRADMPGKVRLGFIPDEWFLFFKPMTGVSGPYIFMLGLGNYLASKEILVMEHEYYLGLSVGLVLYLVITRFGKTIGASLDKQVDAIANALEKGRADELDSYQTDIKKCETAIWRAEGQKDLIDAKKENIALQLEAIYRERLMTVYRTLRGRMDYHVRRHRVENRIKQKWMVQWILENVEKAITPEFKKEVMEKAIRDLDALAARRGQKFGKTIGASLDKQVDAIANALEKGRADELDSYQTDIKKCETAIWRAEGQKDLIDAKKENIALQLEAIYRERLMTVYRTLRGRMDYHVRRHRVENRIKQKWMVQWILENVEKAITPEFKKEVMEKAIRDLDALAARRGQK